MTYLTVPFFTYIEAVLPVWQPLLVVDLVALYLLIFKERFDPRTTVFWIALVFILPFLGFLLYLLYGCTLFTSAAGRRKAAADARYMTGEPDEPPEDAVRLTRALTAAGADVYTSGNAARLWWDAPDANGALEDAMRSAGSTIYVEMNRIPRGESGRMIVDILCERASHGVDVRVLTSVVGFGRTPGLREMRAAGVRHETFHRKVSALLSIKAADRGIRTIIVVDGRFALTGLGAVATVEGRAAARLQRRFLADWEHGTGEAQDVPGDDVPDMGGCGVQTVPSGPDSVGMPMLHGYSEIISESRERLYVTFPFLIPNDEMYNAIKQAVIAGTDVRLLIPARGRHWYQAWNSLAAANELMTSGARVYFSRTAMPRCLVVADGRVVAMGSGIYNSRSLWADYGENVVIHSRDLAAEAEREFLEELDRAAECLPEEYERRSVSDRIRIGVARLFMFLNRRSTIRFINGTPLADCEGVQMADFKVVVNDVKTGKSHNIAVTGHHANSLIGVSVGEVVDGVFLGLPEYKLQVTGGSDRNGTPMRKDLPGNKRVNLLLSDGLGFHERYHGERRRVAIRGNTISDAIVQINMKVVEYGPKSIEEILNPPSEEEAPAENR